MIDRQSYQPSYTRPENAFSEGWEIDQKAFCSYLSGKFILSLYLTFIEIEGLFIVFYLNSEEARVNFADKVGKTDKKTLHLAFILPWNSNALSILRCCGKYVTGIGNVPKWDPPRRKKLPPRDPVEDGGDPEKKVDQPVDPVDPEGLGDEDPSANAVMTNGDNETGHLFESNA